MSNYYANSYEEQQTVRVKHVNRRRKRKKRPSGCLIAFLILFVVIMIVVVCSGIFTLVTFIFGSEEQTSGVDNSKVTTVEEEPPSPIDMEGEDFSLYADGYKERLEIFMKNNPTISKEDATWMINVNMDKEKFIEPTNLTVEDLNQLSVIVSKRFKVPNDYVPIDLVKLTERDSIRKEPKEAFDRLRATAKAEGYQISPASGFRTVEYQKNLYNRYLKTDSPETVDTYSSRPGFSEHHTGMVIDVIGSNGEMTRFGECKESVWVNTNAHKYGFIVRYLPETVDITGYKSEPWHLRYVGVEIATAMKEQGIKTLEEYVGRYVK